MYINVSIRQFLLKLVIITAFQRPEFHEAGFFRGGAIPFNRGVFILLPPGLKIKTPLLG